MSLHERLTTVSASGTVVSLPVNDQFNEIRNRIHQVVIETMGTALLAGGVDDASLATRVRKLVDASLVQDDAPLSAADREQLAREIAD